VLARDTHITCMYIKNICACMYIYTNVYVYVCVYVYNYLCVCIKREEAEDAGCKRHIKETYEVTATYEKRTTK